MSPDLENDPGPAGLAEAGAGLSPGEGCADADFTAPLEALPPQGFSLSDEVRFHPGRSLAAAFLGGLVLGLAMGRAVRASPSMQRSGFS